MNYIKIYNQLCQHYKALNLSKIKDQPGAFEFHHIIPIACGGKNTSDNLVMFPLKAHFIAHHLLKKIYKGTQYEIAMDNAFNLMCNTKTDYHTGRCYGVKATMRVYVNAKLDAAKHKIGDNNPSKRLDVRKKLSVKAKGRPSWNKGLKMKPMSEQQKKELSQKFSGRIWINDGVKDYFVLPIDDRIITFNHGRLHCSTPKSKRKQSIALKGRIPKNKGKHSSKETIEKQRQSMKALIWVTNGIDSKRVLSNQILPGYHKGRKLKTIQHKRKRCIKQFSLSGEFIAEFKSFREIERKLNIKHEYLSRNLSVNKHQFLGYNWYVYEQYE